MDWQPSTVACSPLSLHPRLVDLPSSIDPSVEAYLGTLIGDPSFRFRDLGQYQMFHNLLHRVSHSIRIGPTGSGKTKPLELSLLVQMRSHPNVKGVLVEPYDSIAQEMVIRFNKAGIPTALWKVAHRHYVPDETLVIIPVELVNSEGFRHYLATVARDNLLLWIAFDEVNSVPEDKDFRPALVEAFQTIHQLDTVVTSMTATLAPDTEHHLLDFLNLPAPIRPCVRFIRSPTYRTNIEFDVLTFTDEQGEPRPYRHFLVMAAALVMETMEKAAVEDRGIIFSTTRHDATLWGRIFNCGVIHAAVVGEERRQVYDRWTLGLEPTDRLISVNKAGFYGTNNLNAKYAFQLQMPRTLTDFFQSSGRVGRNQLPGAKSITILPQLPSPVRPDLLQADSPGGDLHIQHVMSGSKKRCIPQGLGRFLDGPSALDCAAIKAMHPSYEECTACRPVAKTYTDYSSYIPLVDADSDTLGSDIRNIVQCGGPTTFLASIRENNVSSHLPLCVAEPYHVVLICSARKHYRCLLL